MLKDELRFRHIHLDFHTSEAIDNIAADFDPEEFAATLEKAKVNSINCFARGHHGWIYFDTKKFPERIHPNTKNRNLLKQQIEACHKRGIRVPIYVTIQWDQFTAERHPEWLVISPDGKQEGTPPYDAGFYRYLCVNTPYFDFLKEHTTEIAEQLPVDGWWFDIVQARDCSCYYCRKEMLERGMDPSDKDTRIAFGKEVMDRFRKNLSEHVRQYDPDAHIFYNAGHIGAMNRGIEAPYSHFELESLPGGAWGYMHFPVTIKYARTLGLDCLGMTGKFHTEWGDFHSFKNPKALECECLRSLAYNAKVCVGDQLHPTGKICRTTYDLIGNVFRQVAEKEAWCKKAKPVIEIAVMNPEEFEERDIFVAGIQPSILGVTRMLQELSLQFDIVDSLADFSQYKVVVLPDDIPVNEELAEKLEKYVADGGKVLASFESGLGADKKQFTSDIFGVTKVCDGPVDKNGQLARGRYYIQQDYAEYVMPNDVIGKDLPKTEHVMYIRGLRVDPTPDAEMIMNKVKAYFNRTYKHFCSHRQTPSSHESGPAVVVRKGNVIYFSNPVFSQYQANAPLWCKKIVKDAIELLLPEQLVCHNGPSFIETTINEQTQENRWVLHLMNYIPIKRSERVEVIEDTFPTRNVKLSVKTSSAPKSIKLAPQGTPVDFQTNDGRTEFTVDEFEGHQMVEIAF